jgi:nucleotide-binding universal stress UspA family protein
MRPESKEMIRILIPLDGSSAAEKAIPHAAAIARTFSAEVELLGVVDGSGTSVTAPVNSLDWQLSKQQTELYLSRVAETLKARGLRVGWELREGDAAQAIIQSVRDADIDILVMTRYGNGNAQVFPMGGTVQKIISASVASVLLIDPAREFDAKRGYAQVLVAVDGSQCSEWASGFAAMVAQASNGSIHVLRIVEEPSLPGGTTVTTETRRFLEHIKRMARSQASLQLRSLVTTIPPNVDSSSSVVTSDNVPATIDETASKVGAELIVIAAQDAHLDSSGSYGPVCEALLSQARRPLLVLRSEAAALSSNHFRSVYLDETETRADAV